MRVLIVGYGKLGSAFAQITRAAGHECWAISRSGRDAPHATMLRGDVTDPATIPKLDPVDAVVYCVSATERTDAGYRDAYPVGLRNIVNALHDSSEATRLLFVSSTGVYGQDDGSWVDESAATTPTRFQGARMVEAEHIALDSGLTASCLRLGGIYGPERTYLLDSVKRGAVQLDSQVRHWTNRIHSHDAARAMLHVLGLERAPQLLNVCDCEPALRDDVLRWIAARTGVSSQAPTEGGSEVLPRPETGKRVSVARLLDTGFAHAYPTFREGYGALPDHGP